MFNSFFSCYLLPAILKDELLPGGVCQDDEGGEGSCQEDCLQPGGHQGQQASVVRHADIAEHQSDIAEVLAEVWISGCCQG